ncbi:MAG: fibrobacter succinogenes major paralogous domain-containing protein [Bacteroidales bacterium]|nr:fibrobacter succinogenes major paralogous domain-containing protein [Bacteroidales bacterium]
MRNFHKLFLLFLLLPFVFGMALISDNESGSLTDERDGKVYKTVFVGGQHWMAQNLDASTFLTGDTIPEAKTKDEWVEACENGRPVWCFYDNKLKNGPKYGKLYNWFAVNDARGLAPKGWHVSTKSDWQLILLKLDDEPAWKLKSKNLWSGKMGSDAFGFCATPGGSRIHNGEFASLKDAGYWWTSDPADETFVYCFYMTYLDYKVELGKHNKWTGHSVRCVKNLD